MLSTHIIITLAQPQTKSAEGTTCFITSLLQTVKQWPRQRVDIRGAKENTAST